MPLDMRFTIRTALIGITFFALVSSVVVLLNTQVRLKSRIESLHDSYGILADDLAEDRIEMMSVGPGLPSNAGTQIFRVENHGNYILTVDFIHGTPTVNMSTKQTYQLNYPQYAITYDESYRHLFLQSTLSPCNGDDYRIDIPFGGAPVSMTPRESRRTISNAPFFAILFGESPVADKAFHNARSKVDLVEYCESNQCNAVTFTLSER